jgi:hypothetical protein
MFAKVQQGAQEQASIVQHRNKYSEGQSYSEGQCFYTPFYQMEAEFNKPRGHFRQPSGTSTVSTQSNAGSWLSHSRQSSGSSGCLTPSSDVGTVGFEEPAQLISVSQAVAHPNHSMVSPTSAMVCDSSAHMTNSAGASQLIPMPSDQIPNSNMVFMQYSMSMPMDMQAPPSYVDQGMSYDYYPQQCAPSLPTMHDNQEQGYMQVGGYDSVSYDAAPMGTTALWSC